MSSTKVKIRVFLSKYFKDHTLKDEDDIFSFGFINSLFAMQLVMFLEKEFSIKIENTDLDVKNFRSINTIYELIERKIVTTT